MLGRPIVHKNSMKNRIKELATVDKLSRRQIKGKLQAENYAISLSTIHSILTNDQNIRWTHSKPKICLSDQAKKRRVEWAANHVEFGPKWRQVIWSDEKIQP